MKKADLVVGDDYLVRGWPAGRARLESLEGSRDRPRSVRMWSYPKDQGGYEYAGPEGQTAMVPLQQIVARWNDPEQVALRVEAAEWTKKEDRARIVLASQGFTVQGPERRRLNEPRPEARFRTRFDEHDVTIDLDAFLRVLDP